MVAQLHSQSCRSEVHQCPRILQRQDPPNKGQYETEFGHLESKLAAALDAALLMTMEVCLQPIQETV